MSYNEARPFRENLLPADFGWIRLMLNCKVKEKAIIAELRRRDYVDPLGVFLEAKDELENSKKNVIIQGEGNVVNQRG